LLKHNSVPIFSFSPGPPHPHLERKMRGARERKSSRRATKNEAKQLVVVIFAE
jgi:hypothetical protein